MQKPLTGVAVGLIVLSGASVALAAVPGISDGGGAAPKVKPEQIVYTADGGALFAGAHRVSKHNLGSIHWSRWTSTKAVGSGANWFNDCNPFCFNGTYHGFAVTLKLTRPKVIRGHDVFTRMRVTYTGKAPSNTPTSQTWTFKRFGKMYFWNP
jgi:hypothetical protein